jgi:hypothetical protein
MELILVIQVLFTGVVVLHVRRLMLLLHESGEIPVVSGNLIWGHMFQGGESLLQGDCEGFDSPLAPRNFLEIGVAEPSKRC